MSGDGTPIRLIFDTGLFGEWGDDNGKAFPPMELTALSMALSVERKVGGMAMPFTGGMRFGMDLNMVNSTIVIEGIFTDDDVNRRVVSPRAASAVIDFAVRQGDSETIGHFTQVDNQNFTQIEDATFTGIAESTVYTVFYATNDLSTTSGSYDTPGVTNVLTDISVTPNVTTIYLHPTNYLTPSQMATSLATALGSSHLNAPFSSSITTSEFVPAAGSSKITLTQTATGSAPVDSVVFTSNTGSTYNPHYRSFFGGSAGTATENAKSGGDKAQDLYGILHNTDRGLAAIVMGIAMVAATVSTGGAALAVGIAAGGATALTSLKTVFNGDYPIGIQIPYNSMITAENGEKYALRNFLIPTGITKGTMEKVSNENDYNANREFSTRDDTTGIQGTVQKLDIGYNAGEQHYTYQMVFAPIDQII